MSAANDIYTKTQTRLDLWYLAEEKLLGANGVQSYTIGDRTLTKVDAEIITNTITMLEKRCLKYDPARRGAVRVQSIVPRDV